MPDRSLVLASASPARLRLLAEAGFAPQVVVSGVREDDIDAPTTAQVALALAERKASAVAQPAGDSVVVGCDSLLDFDGKRLGKPTSHDQARSWLSAMRGSHGTLFTGHCLIDERSGRRAVGVAGTLVRFAVTTDQELDAYLATDDALAVAGAFTLDGRSAPFIEGIDGDPGNVIGLSLPLFRTLLAELDLTVMSLWA